MKRESLIEQVDSWVRIAAAVASYARDFAHGATGHNDMLIIAKMAELLDERD